LFFGGTDRLSDEESARSESTMGVGALFADEEAVGPVIGVILMMAITVVLAAVIGASALGFSDIDPTS
jgi:flagellin-like protein